MSKYRSITKSLLKREKDGKSPQTYFLSIYFPLKDYTKIQRRQRVKSLMLNAFRSHRKLEKKNWLHSKIVNETNRKIDLLKGKGEGLALFAKFEASKSQKKERKITEIKLLLLHKEPEKKIYIGKAFNLDQLIWIDNVRQEALVLNINKKKCDFYLLKKGELSFLTTEENKYLTEEEKEYLGKYGGSKFKGVYYSTGSENIKRRENEAVKKFLGHIVRIAKSNFELKSGFDYLIIFFSNIYSEPINRFKKEFPKHFPETALILEEKYIQKEKNLRKLSKSKLRKEEKEIERKLFSQAKSRSKLFVKGWNKVLKQARMRKIETLFIKPKAKKKGYILGGGFVFNYPVKNSKMVRNISPWLIKTVLQGGGKIFVLRDKKEKFSVAAKLINGVNSIF